jgi:hypothetical protein
MSVRARCTAWRWSSDRGQGLLGELCLTAGLGQEGRDAALRLGHEAALGIGAQVVAVGLDRVERHDPLPERRLGRRGGSRRRGRRGGRRGHERRHEGEALGEVSLGPDRVVLGHEAREVAARDREFVSKEGRGRAGRAHEDRHALRRVDLAHPLGEPGVEGAVRLRLDAEEEDRARGLARQDREQAFDRQRAVLDAQERGLGGVGGEPPSARAVRHEAPREGNEEPVGVLRILEEGGGGPVGADRRRVAARRDVEAELLERRGLSHDVRPAVEGPEVGVVGRAQDEGRALGQGGRGEDGQGQDGGEEEWAHGRAFPI